jgi:hypothetical protein
MQICNTAAEWKQIEKNVIMIRKVKRKVKKILVTKREIRRDHYFYTSRRK